MKRLASFGCLLVVIAVMVLTPAGAWAFRRAGLWLDVSEPPRPADLIVALGGDRTRQEEAARLFRVGYGKKVIFTGANSRACDYSCAGLPEDKCLPIPPAAFTTKEEASVTHALIGKDSIRSILVVTNGYHTRRARLLFEHSLKGSGVTLQVVGVPTPAFPLGEWWRNHMGRKAVVSEYMALAYYEVREML